MSILQRSGDVRLFERKLPRRLVGFLVSLMFSFATSWALVASHGLEVSVGAVLLWCALCLAVLSICFYNKITAAVTLLALACLIFYQFRWNDALDRLTGDGLDWLETVFGFLTGGEKPEAELHFGIAMIFIGASTLFAYLSAGHLSGGRTMGLVAIVFFLVLWYLGHRSFFPQMALCAMSTAFICAVSYGRKRARAEERELERDYDEADADRLLAHEGDLPHEPHVVSGGGAAALALLAAPYAITVCLLILIFNPAPVSHSFQSMAVEAAVDDVVDYVGVHFGFERDRSAFTLSAAGWGSSAELGGPVEPYVSTTLEVYGTSPSLLTGTYRDVYTGSGWIDSGRFGTYRFDSGMWEELRSDTFCLDLPGGNFELDAAQLYRSIAVTVVPHRHLGTLFAAGRPLSVYGSTRSFVPYFSAQGELFPKEQLSFMESYTVRARQWNAFSSRAINTIVALEKEVPAEDAERMASLKALYLPNGNVNIITASPRDVGDSVTVPYTLAYKNGRIVDANYSALALSLAREAGSESRFVQAMAIRSYLMNNFEYTLTPPEKTDENADFVNWFLATGEGYCTYYATAMAVMAREIGIPSRYVEGYLVTNVEHEDYHYTLTGENAHAWAELYFEGIGWIPFDASPIGQRISNAPVTTPSITEPEMPTPTPTYQPGEDWQPEEDSDGGTPLWVIVLIAVAGLAVLLTVPLILFAVSFSPKLVVAKYGRRGAVRVWWREISDILPHYDEMFLRRGGETAIMYSRRIGALVACPVCTFEQLTRVVIRAYYRAAEPGDIELELVWRYLGYLRRGLISRMTPGVFIVRRLIFPRLNGFRGKPTAKADRLPAAQRLVTPISVIDKQNSDAARQKARIDKREAATAARRAKRSAFFGKIAAAFIKLFRSDGKE